MALIGHHKKSPLLEKSNFDALYSMSSEAEVILVKPLDIANT